MEALAERLAQQQQHPIYKFQTRAQHTEWVLKNVEYKFSPGEQPFFIVHAPSQLGFVCVPYSYLDYWQQRFPFEHYSMEELFKDYYFQRSSHTVVGFAPEQILSSVHVLAQMAVLAKHKHAFEKIFGQVVSTFLGSFQRFGMRMHPNANTASMCFVSPILLSPDGNSFEQATVADKENLWRQVLSFPMRNHRLTQIREFRNLSSNKLLSIAKTVTKGMSAQKLLNMLTLSMQQKDMDQVQGLTVMSWRNASSPVEVGQHRVQQPTKLIFTAAADDWEYQQCQAQLYLRQAEHAKEHRHDPRLAAAFLDSVFVALVNGPASQLSWRRGRN